MLHAPLTSVPTGMYLYCRVTPALVHSMINEETDRFSSLPIVHLFTMRTTANRKIKTATWICRVTPADGHSLSNEATDGFFSPPVLRLLTMLSNDELRLFIMRENRKIK